MHLDHPNGIVHRSPDVERPVARARQRRENRGAGRVGVARRADEGTHWGGGQGKQIGDDVGLANVRDFGHPAGLEQVGVIVVRGVVDRRRIGGAAGRVNDLPQCSFRQREVGKGQAKTLGGRHQTRFCG